MAGPAHGEVILNLDGSFGYTPNASFGDTDSFTYKASNGSLDSNVATVTIRRNHPPTITSSPSTSGAEGQPYSYDVGASDPDAGDRLTFSLLTAPAGTAIDPLTGLIRWTPSRTQAGRHDVEVRVDDGRGGTASQRFTIAVAEALSNAPVIMSTPVTTATEGVLYQYDVDATDADGDALTFSLIITPIGMTIDRATGLIRWTPAGTQAGNHAVAVRVTDGHGGSYTQSYTIAVAEAINNPPIITSNPITTATEGVPYRYAFTVFDPDNDDLGARLPVWPDGMAFDPTGAIVWTPDGTQSGIHEVVLEVADGRGGVATQRYAITVAEAINNPPVITSPPVTMGAVGNLYQYNVLAADSDHDLLTYSLTTAPAGMTIHAETGLIAWTPASAQLGDHPVEVRVQDPGGLFATQSFMVKVQAQAGPDTTPPSVSVSADPAAVNPGQSTVLTVVTTDNVGVTSRALTVNGTPLNLDGSGRAAFSTNTPGLYTAVATARDAAGNVGTGTATIRVNDPADTTLPVVSLAAPAADAVIEQVASIVGTASDANLARYELSLAPAGEDTFTTVASGTSSVTDGVLGHLDPTLLQNGIYRVRLTAEDVSGNTASTERVYRVAGDAQVGLFTLSFTDLELPLAGLPIQVVRTYDSRDKRTGDFGVGWTLDIKTVRLQENRVTGSDWQGTRSGGLFPTYCIQPTRPHIVTITLPDGKVEQFEPTLSPQCQQLVPTDQVTIGFRPLPGTNAALAPVGGALASVSGPFPGDIDLIGDLDNPSPFDADQYLLTLQDGRALTIDQRAGLQKIADLNGNTLTITRDGITHSSGQGVTFARDGQGRITSIADPLGKTIAYTYDANGDLASVTDQAGNTTSFTYNASHGLLTIKDPRGVQPIRNEYDESGRLIAHVDASGNRVAYTHDIGARQESVQDRLGRLTVYSYNQRGDVVGQTDPAGNTTTFTYDTRGNKLSETDPLGHMTTYTYDGHDNLLTQTDPQGNTTSYTYNERGQVLTTADPLGRLTTNTYDASGNLRSTKDPLGNETRYAYDSRGLQTSMTDALGNVTRYEYDGSGNLTKETDALGHKTRYEYDKNNRRTRVIYPDDTVQITEYDALGRSVAQTDQAGETTRYEYDALGRLIKVTDALGRVTHYSYDEAGSQLTQTDALGRTTRFAYDSMGRRTQRALPLGMAETYAYDVAGNLKSKTDFNGKTTTYEYDNLNRLTHKTPDASLGQPLVSFTYTLTGQRASMTDASATTTYTYDARDRLLSKATPWGTLSYSYDTAGNLRSIRSGHANGASVDYAYDALNRLAAVKDNNLAGGTTTYAYDANGNLAGYEYPNQVRTSYTYDKLNRLTEMSVARPAVTLARYTYTLGSAGNRLSVAELDGRTASSAYDDLYRLMSETISGDPNGVNGAVGYSYDPVGNRLSRSSTVAPVSPDIYAYDANDRLTRDGYDANGNTIASNSHTYTYDFENHLTGMDNGAATFVYDGDGNRVAKTAGGVTTRYLVDDRNPTGYAQVLEEIQDGAVQRSYTYGSDLISQRQLAGGAWATSFYGYDGHGSVRFLTDAAGGGDGSV